jgi:hypothetical protein
VGQLTALGARKEGFPQREAAIAIEATSPGGQLRPEGSGRTHANC